MSGAQDSCYILYAQVPGKSTQVKQGIVMESEKVNDAGEANAYTTAQVIIYEIAKANFPDQVKCSGIPNLEPTPELIAAVRSVLAKCQDAQSDGTIHALATSVWRISSVVCPGPVFPAK